MKRSEAEPNLPKRLWIFLDWNGKNYFAGESQMAKDIINDIRANTRRKFSADEKIRIVVEGLTPS